MQINNSTLKNIKKLSIFHITFINQNLEKGLKIPYFTYLSSVSNLIIENNGNTDEAIAGLLHDLLEFDDNKKKINVIKSRFGIKVLNIVKQCSNASFNNLNKEDWLSSKKNFSKQ